MASATIVRSTGEDLILSGRTVFLAVAVGVIAAAVQALSLQVLQLDTVAALAMLVFGLPHGALDIALLRRAGLRGHRAVALAVAGYLAAAAAMFALWTVAPALALAAFLLIGIVHFAEDWADDLPRFVAHGTALALIAAPALLHGEALTDLFALLGAGASARPLTQLLLLVAPIALITAMVGVAMLAIDARTDDAIATAACLVAMIVLPPVIGFALFFCVRHSPINYARARAALGKPHRAEARRDTLWLSLAALGLAAAIATFGPGSGIDSPWIHATFVTLSILTVPHMLAGLVGQRLAARNACESVSSE